MNQLSLLKEVAETAEQIGIVNTVKALRILKDRTNSKTLLLIRYIIDESCLSFGVIRKQLKKSNKSTSENVHYAICVICVLLKNNISFNNKEIGMILDKRSEGLICKNISEIKNLESKFKQHQVVLLKLSEIQARVNNYLNSLTNEY